MDGIVRRDLGSHVDHYGVFLRDRLGTVIGTVAKSGAVLRTVGTV